MCVCLHMYVYDSVAPASAGAWHLCRALPQSSMHSELIQSIRHLSALITVQLLIKIANNVPTIYDAYFGNNIRVLPTLVGFGNYQPPFTPKLPPLKPTYQH